MVSKVLAHALLGCINHVNSESGKRTRIAAEEVRSMQEGKEEYLSAGQGQHRFVQRINIRIRNSLPSSNHMEKNTKRNEQEDKVHRLLTSPPPVEDSDDDDVSVSSNPPPPMKRKEK
eukprot:scaffold5106_cov69-Cylindrotheca_fusiformis.AAC.1